MAQNPIETASDELKKWLDQLQKYYQFKIDEEKKAQALAKEQAKEALAAERHEEMMEELRGMREGKAEGMENSPGVEDFDDTSYVQQMPDDWEPENWQSPEPEVDYHYEKDIKDAQKFKERFNDIPDGNDKAEFLREEGPGLKNGLDEFRKEVKVRPDSPGKEALLKELDDIDQMLDYEAYAQEHGLEEPEVNGLNGADDVDAADMAVEAKDIDISKGADQALQGMDQAVEQASNSIQKAAGAVAGGAAGAPAVAAPAAAPAAGVGAPAAAAPAASAPEWKKGSVGEALKKEGYPVRRQGGQNIKYLPREQKIGAQRRK